MSVNLSKEDANIGQIIYQWKVKEYETPERDRRWFIAMTIFASILLIYGFWTSNHLFVLVIVLFALIIYLHHHQEPLDVNFAMTKIGIVIGNIFYRYSEFDSFWIIYNPPEVKNLYFAKDKWLKHRMVIPLLDHDPLPIRHYLGQYLDEDINEEEEPLSDRVTRLFKF